MKRFLAVLAVVALVFLSGIDAQAARRSAPTASTQTITGRCVRALDADTITVSVNNKQIRVRLYGIDAPELRQAYGTWARQFTSSLASRKVVTVYSKGTDPYGQVLGWVFVGPQCVNAELVRNGLAWHDKQSAPNEAKLAALEQEARQQSRGLWRDPRAVPPWVFRQTRLGIAAPATAAPVAPAPAPGGPLPGVRTPDAPATTAPNIDAPATTAPGVDAAFTSQQGYSITPPSGWATHRSGQTETTGAVGVVGAVGADVVFLSRPRNGFAANITVVVTRVDNDTLETARAQIDQEYPRIFNQFEWIERGNTMVDGVPALTNTATYTMEIPGTTPRRLWMHQIMALNNGLFYVFTCTALDEYRSTFQPTFDDALKSIRWTRRNSAPASDGVRR